jgi:hypothetical protein
MKTLLVLPFAHGWEVRLEDGERLIDVASRQYAVEVAFQWASNHRPCEVRTFTQTGELDRVDNFPSNVHKLNSNFRARLAETRH